MVNWERAENQVLIHKEQNLSFFTFIQKSLTREQSRNRDFVVINLGTSWIVDTPHDRVSRTSTVHRAVGTAGSTSHTPS